MNNVAFSRHCGLHQLQRKTLQLMKAAVPAESYVIHLSSASLVSCDVYGQQPGRCRTLSSLLIHFLSLYLSRFSFYFNNHEKICNLHILFVDFYQVFNSIDREEMSYALEIKLVNLTLEDKRTKAHTEGKLSKNFISIEVDQEVLCQLYYIILFTLHEIMKELEKEHMHMLLALYFQIK